MHITEVLSLAEEPVHGSSIQASFFDHHLCRNVAWSPGAVGVLTVSVPDPSGLFELSLDIDEDGVCHRQQAAGVKKRYALLQSLLGQDKG